MALKDNVFFNGSTMSWEEFITFWKNKAFGGWDFSDCLGDLPKKQKFEVLWMSLGPIYC